MKIAKQLVLALGIVSLAACGGGGGSGEPGATAPISNDVENVSTNTGSNSSTSTGNTSTTESTSTNGSSTSTNTTTGGTTTSGDAPNTSSNTTGDTPTTAPSPQEPASSSAVSLTWDIPAVREDGSYLAVYEIDGYELRYSKDNSNTETVVRIADAQTTDWVLENAEPGYYEFTIATIDSDGVYSQYSAPASKTIE